MLSRASIEARGSLHSSAEFVTLTEDLTVGDAGREFREALNSLFSFRPASFAIKSLVVR